MSDRTYTSGTSPQFTLVSCACCRRHGHPALVVGPLVRCDVCGEWCACEGCHAEQDR